MQVLGIGWVPAKALVVAAMNPGSHAFVYPPSTGAATPNTPNMFALDAATGKVLWSFPSGGSVAAGAVVVNGTVYWGSGYGRVGFVGGQNKFFVFSLGGK